MPFGNTSTFSALFSDGANNFIAALDPGERPEGKLSFPPGHGWRDGLSDVNKNENVHDWFRRVVGSEDKADSRISECAVREDLALLGTIIWARNGVQFCGFQALITTGGNLRDYYLTQSPQDIHATYYRLDLDMSIPGPLFKEPLPHIHCVPHGEPRFQFVFTPEDYLPVAFVEFLYLNHFHDTWVKWAKAESSKRQVDLPFDGIVDGFETGSIISRVGQFADHLARLKLLLTLAKRQRVPNAPRLNPLVTSLNYMSP